MIPQVRISFHPVANNFMHTSQFVQSVHSVCTQNARDFRQKTFIYGKISQSVHFVQFFT